MVCTYFFLFNVLATSRQLTIVGERKKLSYKPEGLRMGARERDREKCARGANNNKVVNKTKDGFNE